MSLNSIGILNSIERLLIERKWDKAQLKLSQVENEIALDENQAIKFSILKGRFLVNTFHFQEAQTLIVEILNILPALNKRLFTIDVSLLQADLALELGNLDDSLNHLNKARSYLNTHDQFSDFVKWSREEYLNEIEGNLYLLQGQFESSLSNFRIALNLASKLKDEYLLFYIYRRLGYLYRIWGKYTLALENYQQCLKIGEDLKDDHLLGQAYDVLGFTYANLGKLDIAIEYGRKGVALLRKTDNVALLWALNSLGVICWTKGYLNEALKYLNEELQIANKTDNRKALGHIFNNMGLIYYSKGQVDNALQCLKSSLEIKKELNDIQGQRMALGNIAGIYSEIGDLKLAIEFFKKSLELYDEIEDKFGRTTVLFDLHSLYLKTQDITEAEKIIDEMEKLSAETHEKIILQRYQLLRANLLSINQNESKKQEAQKIYEDIANSDETHNQIYFPAHLHLCELLFESYINSGDSTILNRLNNYLQRILRKSEHENLFNMTNSAYLIIGKLELLKLNNTKAEQIIMGVKQRAENNGYDKLVQQAKYDLARVNEYVTIQKILDKNELELRKKNFQEKQQKTVLTYLNELISQKLVS